jgi:hypothetical protein
MLIPIFEPVQQVGEAKAIRNLAEENALILEIRDYGVAIPMRPTGVGVLSLIELNAAFSIQK